MSMLGRIVDVASDDRHLAIVRGFLVVRQTSSEPVEVGRVPIDAVLAVVAHGHGLSYSNNLLVGLAERGAPLVICDRGHRVVAMLMPIEGHHVQAERFDAQARASARMKGRIWAELVRAKIRFQAATLAGTGRPHVPLLALIGKVRSGDPTNVEAQAARRMWTLLFGPDFRRDRFAAGANAMLNYGYAVLRAAVGRAVVAAGLHPTLGVHHANAGNAMRLVDDLMEPFRPRVDLAVWRLLADGVSETTPEARSALVRCLHEDLVTPEGRTPLAVCAQRLSTSLAQIYLGERTTLDLPTPPHVLSGPGDAG